MRLKKVGNSTVTYFKSICRDCEQKERNEKKNQDRPLAIIQQRAKDAATRYGVSLDFFWTQMNFQALVQQYRAALLGACNACGHKFLNERDIQIEHILPPRHGEDWARLHTRNLRLLCGSCNRTKSHKDFSDWLDEQEQARLSNLSERSTLVLTPPSLPDEEPWLFPEMRR